MTENEYILTTDLRAVNILRSVLHHLIPGNNPHIPAEEIRAVQKIVIGWESKLYKAVKIK